MNLGKQAKHLRINLDLTLRALAKEVGCSASTLSRFERGAQEVAYATLLKIFERLGRPLQIELGYIPERDETQVITRFPVHIERLAHFQCPDCLGWWSIGDNPADKHWWYCPWCGKCNCFERKDQA